MKDLKGRRLLRQPPGPVARVTWLTLFYLVLWPMIKALELFGRWPRLASRGMARMAERMKPYEPNEHDVLVCSYFKTGTNWTMQIATQVAFRGRGEFEHIHDVVPWLELPPNNRFVVPMSDETARAQAPTGLRVIKTHLGLRQLGYDPRPRYICVARDPKDVFVSSYHFIRAVMLGPATPSVEKWLDLYLSEDTFCGSWAEHLQGGWEKRHEPNVLFLTYEEMRRDLRTTVERIAELMGVQLASDELDACVHRSSYEYMKSAGHKFDTVGMSPPWAKARGSMIRRGKSGGADELITPAQQRRIDDYWRAELERLGSDFPYDEAFGRAT